MDIPYTGPALISLHAMPGFIYGAEGRDLSAVAPTAGVTVNAPHHVGPMEHFESLIAAPRPGFKTIYWENRGRPLVETEYDPAAPDVPIDATLKVAPYSVKFTRLGRPPRYSARYSEQSHGRRRRHYRRIRCNDSFSASAGSWAHTSFDIERTLPPGTVQWRVGIARSPSISSPADAFQLDCGKKAVCAVVAQQSITLNGALLVADKPNQWS
jgi:hypothetical protein